MTSIIKKFPTVSISRDCATIRPVNAATMAKLAVYINLPINLKKISVAETVDDISTLFSKYYAMGLSCTEPGVVEKGLLGMALRQTYLAPNVDPRKLLALIHSLGGAKCPAMKSVKPATPGLVIEAVRVYARFDDYILLKDGTFVPDTPETSIAQYNDRYGSEDWVRVELITIGANFVVYI